ARVRRPPRRRLRRRAPPLEERLLPRSGGSRPALADGPGRQRARPRRTPRRGSRGVPGRHLAPPPRPPHPPDVPALRAPGRLAQLLERLVELGIGDRQRRRGLDQGTVGARRDDKDAARQRILRVAFARTEKAAAAPARLLEALSGLAYAVEQLRHLLEHDEGRGAGEWVPDVCVRVHVLGPELPHVLETVPIEQRRRERQAAA